MILVHSMILFASPISSKRYNPLIMTLKGFNLLQAEANKCLGLTLTDQQMASLARYASELIIQNQVHNLTAITEPQQIRHKHFLDSLSCLLVLPERPGRVIDIGTGAGFPGLVLRIVRPEIQLTLVDSSTKKTGFLSHLVQVLDLEGVTIIHSRAESLGRNNDHREKYDWAVARAVARLSILLEYLLPLVKVGGYVLAQKGGGLHQELEEADHALTELGGVVEKEVPARIPDGEQHYLLVVRKNKPTPSQYPRREGIPKKRPL